MQFPQEAHAILGYIAYTVKVYHCATGTKTKIKDIILGGIIKCVINVTLKQVFIIYVISPVKYIKD